MQDIKIEWLDPATLITDGNIRSGQDEASMAELKASIESVGILFPLFVTTKCGKRVVVDGARRLRAALEMNLTQVPAMEVAEGLDVAAILQRQLIANCMREELSPLDQARAIRQLMIDLKIAAVDAAKMIGRSPATVSKLLSLLQLPPSLQQKVADGTLGLRAGHELSRKTNARGTPPQTSGATNVVEAVGSSTSQRLVAYLDRKTSITFSGIEGTTVAMIGVLKDLLNQTCAAQKQGLGVKTYLAMLKDRARQTLGA